MDKKPNILFLGIDSLRSDHTSLYGYKKLTTPHMDKFFSESSVIFEKMYSPSIPTTPGYASMLTGLDCFSTDIVALRHKGGLREDIKTLPEVLVENGYRTVNIGYGNYRGFQENLSYKSSWGSWAQGRSPKAASMNEVAIPKLNELAQGEEPFMLFLRHMDPHSPYLPPEPFDRLFFNGDEFDKNNKSLEPVYAFKPFCDYFYTWFPPFCTSSDYIIAQYDGAIAYMDSCIAILLNELEHLGIADNTIVVATSDHGETLYDHDCYFDHHSLYDNCLVVPLAIKFPKKFKGCARRYKDYAQLKDIMPTLLPMLGIETDIKFDGRNLCDVVSGKAPQEPEFYITEATWMRKHGWRTPEWKLMIALEPDFHFKPEIELYNLIKDPDENHNLAEEEPEVVKFLTERMLAHIAKRESETGRTNPMYTNLDWSGFGRPFASSEEAYNTLHIGDPEAAKKLQEMKK
ncbi:MAG: sulfatase-like hydrolase/transferase [Clostridiales bacterium]|nr:sulfatase-like hydrolase/transferase [Clostridiales bacterium]